MRISDWSSDVCSSDLKAEEDEVMKFIASAAVATALLAVPVKARCFDVVGRVMVERSTTDAAGHEQTVLEQTSAASPGDHLVFQFDYSNARPTVARTFVITNPIPAQMVYAGADSPGEVRSEAHTSELQSLMRI